LMFPRPVVDTAYPAFECLKRGILTTNGYLLDLHAVFEVLKKDTDLMAAEQARCAGLFYLSELAAASGLSVPNDFLSEFRANWTANHVVGNLASWLPQIGLTQGEFDQLLNGRATHAYLLQQAPESLGFSFTDQRMAVEALAQWYSQTATCLSGKAALLAQERAELSTRAIAGCLVTNWAESRGIQAPEEVVEQFITRWEQREAIGSRECFLKAVGLTDQQFLLVWSQQAMYQWMLEKGPMYFGFGTYSFPQALMQDMQITGAVLPLCAQMQQEDLP